MKLSHPDSKQTVETDSPDIYLSQGWVESAPKPSPKSDDK